MLVYMENLFIILFLVFLVLTIVAFALPSLLFKNKTAPTVKKIKISLIAITILFFVLFGVTSDASKQNKTQGNQDTAPIETTIQNTPTPAKDITYEVIKTWEIPNGGFGKVIVISPENFNLSDMTSLGEKLKNDHKSDRNSFIFIFDDKKAAEMRDKISTTDLKEISEADHDYYDKHYIGEYTKNGNNDYHQLTIYFDGVTGIDQKTIKY